MNRRIILQLATVLALMLSLNSRAADWPQFRGPNRDNVWNETGILKTFPAKGLKIRWRAPVGPGWSSPVVVRGRVYLTDMRLEKPRAWERIQCFKESTGKLLWSRESELVYPDWAFIPEHGGGPAATPIVEDGKIYSLGRNGQVDCLDARNGKVIWEVQLGQKYEIRELVCRGSPLIEGNLLIVFTGAKPGACVLALDKRTGEEIWKALDERVGNSSPLVIVAGGQRQLIVWTDESVASLNPVSGETYWREPMVTSDNDSIPTPVAQKNRLLISGLMYELNADQPTAKVLWPESKAPSKRLLSNTSTAILRDDYIYSAKIQRRTGLSGGGHRQSSLGDDQRDETANRCQHPPDAQRRCHVSFYRRRELDFSAPHPRQLPRDQPCASAQTNLNFVQRKVCLGAAGLRQPSPLCPQR